MIKSHLVLFFLLLSFSEVCFAGNIYSFEDGVIPAAFRVKSGSLAIQTKKAKLGTKSLQWNWVAGDALIAAPLSLSAVSVQQNGGINAWIYNENASDQKLILRFYEYETSTTRRCSLEVNLNFKGWRCIWANFRTDMNHPGYTLRSMKWEAPSTGSGTILIDYLEFVNNISWERISDRQYTVKNFSTELENFVDVRNVVSAHVPTMIDDKQRTALQTIERRVDDWYSGTGKFSPNSQYKIRKTAFDNYVQQALNKTSDLSLTTLPDGTVCGPGLFPLDFYNLTIDGVSVDTFREINEKYMVQLAYDAIINNNTSSRDLILKIFDWYYDQGWADGSGLGRLRFEMLRSSGFYHAAYLMRDAMSDVQLNRVQNASKWFTLFGKIDQTPVNPGENTDQIRTLLVPKLLLALSIKNELVQAAALQSFVKYANNALSVSGGFLDCLKPDFSGYHHRGPYNSAYYPDALYAGALVCYYLSGTPYSLSDQTYSNLKNALLTFSFMCADYDVPGATTGRFPEQTQVLDKLLPAFAYLALATPTPDAELTATFKRLWKPTVEPMKSFVSRVRSDLAFKNSPGEVEKMVELAESTITAEKNPLGSKYMPYSGLLITRQPNWVITAKGFSKYIWDFETSTFENRYGRYLSYGQVELSRLGTNMHSYNPSYDDWDWSHIPGTTSKYLTKGELDSQLNPNLHRSFSDETFLGGIAFNHTTSVFSNSIHDNSFDVNFYAKKSVFQFDSVYYCLGSGIKNADKNYFVHTTLFQNLKQNAVDQIFVNGIAASDNQIGIPAPVLKDNFGNAYIVKEGNVNIELGSTFMSAYINHGRVQTDGRYAYLIVTNASNTSSSCYSYPETSPFEVLRHDNTSHAIYFKSNKVLSTVVFDAEPVLNIKRLYRVNVPCVVVTQEKNDTLEVAFSDPDMHRPSAANIGQLSFSDVSAESAFSPVRIELNGDYEIISSVKDVKVQNEAGKTIITYDNAKDGNTYRVLLRLLNTSFNDEHSRESSMRIVQVANSNVYNIETVDQELYSYRLFNPMGKLLVAKTDVSGSSVVSIDNFPKGLYVLYAETKKDQIYKKILR